MEIINTFIISHFFELHIFSSLLSIHAIIIYCTLSFRLTTFELALSIRLFFQVSLLFLWFLLIFRRSSSLS